MFNRSIKKLNINRQFEKSIKEVAIDCKINKDGNLVRLDEKYTPVGSGYYQLNYENYSTGELYVRSNVKSQKNPGLPENILTIEDILSNVAKNTKGFTFKNMVTGEIINKLIIPENINCETVDYSFENVPEKISNLTQNKELIPQLIQINPKQIYDYLYSVSIKTITPTDPTLRNKISKLIDKSYVNKKQKLIEKLSELGYEASEDIWELYTLKELEIEYINLSKIK
jgi:hypothetical protein